MVWFKTCGSSASCRFECFETGPWIPEKMFILHRVLLVPKVIHMVKWRNILAAGGHLALLRGITIAMVYYLGLISPILYNLKNNIHQNKSTSGTVFV